ncbi:MAG: ELM1/GtrOC1 family putative glycosyltransferase, partial [Pseudomonadota bacterium]
PAPVEDPRLAARASPRVAVLLGGPSGAARWTKTDVAALAQGLAALGAQGVGLVVTPSRRTPPALLDAARAAPGAWVWDGAGANPYPAMLHGAAAALVTADSVNMASEAATAGLPVLVAPVSGLSPKLRRFHAAFEARGHARPFRGALETWSPPPLDEAARVAARLATHYIGRP